MSMINKLIRFTAKPGCSNDLLTLLRGLVAPSKVEPGCLKYELYQSRSDRFILLESWQDQAALDAHKNTAHFAHFKAQLDAYCVDKTSEAITAIE